MLSSIQINYLSYRVVPLVMNGITPVIENKFLKIEAVSKVGTNLGYNYNNPANLGSAVNSTYDNSDNLEVGNYIFQDMLDIEIKKIVDSVPSNGTNIKKR